MAVPLVITVTMMGLLWPTPVSMYTVGGVWVVLFVREMCVCSEYSATLTVIARRCTAYCRHWTAARHQKLIRIADVIQGFRLCNHQIVEIQTHLTDVRMDFLYAQLTTAGAVVRIRMIGIDEIGAIVASNAAA